jgi:DnaJ-class molecular chaperone
MGLGPDILEKIESKEALIAVFKNRFRTLAMKLHPDMGGDSKSFIMMNEAYEYLKRWIIVG